MEIFCGDHSVGLSSFALLLTWFDVSSSFISLKNDTSDTETSLFENFIRLSTWSEVLTFSTLMLQLFCHWLVFFFKQNKLSPLMTWVSVPHFMSSWQPLGRLILVKEMTRLKQMFPFDKNLVNHSFCYFGIVCERISCVKTTKAKEQRLTLLSQRFVDTFFQILNST